MDQRPNGNCKKEAGGSTVSHIYQLEGLCEKDPKSQEKIVRLDE